MAALGDQSDAPPPPDQQTMAAQNKPISNIVIIVGTLRCYVIFNFLFYLIVLILMLMLYGMNNSYADGSTSHSQQIPAHRGT